MVADKIVISGLAEQQNDAWDRYVEVHPQATFFHKSGWKRVLERAFGHTGHYLLAQCDGVICGVLPLVHMSSYLFSNALVSIPFGVYGGVLADSPAIKDRLLDKAAALAEELGVDYLELRDMYQPVAGWPGKELYVTFRKELDPDPEVNMKAIPRKQRAMVRKGIKEGLCTEWDDGIDRFFDIYAVSVRNHGTPVFAKKYFKILHETFRHECGILTATKDGVPVSSVFTFFFRNEVLPYYGGGTLEARRVKAFDYMYWELMRYSCVNGYTIFDYGRSKIGTGSYSFKKNWGFEPQPLYYSYKLVKSSAVPDINPLNPKYQLFIKAWQRLPVMVANRIGPLLSRGLG